MDPDPKSMPGEACKLAEEIAALEAAFTARRDRLRRQLKELIERTVERVPGLHLEPEMRQAEFRQAQALNDEIAALAALERELESKRALLQGGKTAQPEQPDRPK